MERVSLIDTCDELGSTPTYIFQKHGILVRIATDSVEVNREGFISFENKGQRVLRLSTVEVEFLDYPGGRPDNLIASFKECIVIKHTDTREILGWLCWE